MKISDLMGYRMVACEVSLKRVGMEVGSSTRRLGK